MRKILLILLFAAILIVPKPEVFAANPLCASAGVQLYTTDANGNTVGPAKDIPFNIEIRSPRIQASSIYKIQLKAGNSGRIVDTYLIQATENGTASTKGLQMSGDNPGPFLFTLSETRGGSDTVVCDSNTFMLLAAPLSSAQMQQLQAQQAKTSICTGKECTIGAGQRCNLSDGNPINTYDKTRYRDTGIYTAIGCIPTEPKKLVEDLLKYGTFAAGGVAFLIMILASLQMITAEGNPESLKQARDKFYSAIIGLLIIIFSVLLMQVIGVDILNLPGFAK